MLNWRFLKGQYTQRPIKVVILDAGIKQRMCQTERSNQVMGFVNHIKVLLFWSIEELSPLGKENSDASRHVDVSLFDATGVCIYMEIRWSRCFDACHTPAVCTAFGACKLDLRRLESS